MSAELGVEYGSAGPEHAGANGWEAAKSLGAFLGIPATEARSLLVTGIAGPEIRSRRADPMFARRQLERRYAVRLS